MFIDGNLCGTSPTDFTNVSSKAKQGKVKIRSIN